MSGRIWLIVMNEYWLSNIFFLRGIIFISHGFGEHSRRHDKFARLLCSELDVVVVSHDHGECITFPLVRISLNLNQF